MRTKKFLMICVLIVASSIVYAGYIGNFRNLGGATQFDRIEVVNNDVSWDGPVVIERGLNQEFKCSFTAPYACNSVEVKCFLVISGIPTPIALPEIYPTYGMTLPLEKNRNYICYVTVPCPKTLPSMMCKLRIELLDHEKRLIAGAEMAVKLK